MEISDDVFKGAIGLLISIGLIIIGIYFFLKRRRVIRNGVKVTATLMEWEPSGGRSTGVRTYYPVVGYHTTDQRWIVKRYYISRSDQNVKVGGDVEIIYNSQAPEEFIIDNISTTLLGPLFIAVGSALAIGSVVYIVLKY